MPARCAPWRCRRSCHGCCRARLPALAMSSIERSGRGRRRRAGDAFEAQYAAAADQVLRDTGREAFDAMRTLRDVEAKGPRTAGDAAYPRSPFGDALRQVAQLVKADVGLGGRVRRNGRLGHAREPGRRRRPARLPARRRRPHARRPGHRSRHADAGRRGGDDVGVRTDRGGERHARHRSRARQRDAGPGRAGATAAASSGGGPGSMRHSAWTDATWPSPPTSVTSSAK